MLYETEEPEREREGEERERDKTETERKRLLFSAHLIPNKHEKTGHIHVMHLHLIEEHSYISFLFLFYIPHISFIESTRVMLADFIYIPNKRNPTQQEIGRTCC
jgi:hypothetical protein